MIDVALTPDLLHGGAETEQRESGILLHRLPQPYRSREADDQLRLVEVQPSGVRLSLRTAATVVELALRATRVAYRGFARTRGAVDVTVDHRPVASIPLVAGDLLELDLAAGTRTSVPGEPDVIRCDGLPPGDKLVEIWLPHNEQVELVSLRADAPVHAERDMRPVWLHHGSSISQGSNAATPTGIWPVIAAERSGIHLRNLGFGGSAFADPFVARVMRDTPADLLSVKVGINVVNLDAMRLRAFVPAVHGFLDTVRDGHPEAPLLLISPLHAAIHEDTPGPGAVDPAGFADGVIRFRATGQPGDTALGRLTLQVVREALATIAADRADDPHLHVLDGLSLYGPEDADRMPLPDGLHPDAQTHAMIGERFAARVFAAGGPFAMAAASTSG
ncbi:GDSL-type esterase/lipase family protein [Microbacterium sp. HMH0099]|uniref:GDSL-type esterase/lipase family protein n=1 Tax=Microbacterium sp. HMH0099 TaxID=3414026 RepID=UPI003BF76EA8